VVRGGRGVRLPRLDAVARPGLHDPRPGDRALRRGERPRRGPDRVLLRLRAVQDGRDRAAALLPLARGTDAGRAHGGRRGGRRGAHRPRPRAPRGARLMAIDFTLPDDVQKVRARVREFMEHEVASAEDRMRREGHWRRGYAELRERAKTAGLWAPHMPREWGGMGLGPPAMACVPGEGG